MESYVFLQFDELITFKEYEIYKERVIKSLKPYFTNVLFDSYNPNLVSKVFSVHISFGSARTNHNKNLFYRYLTYSSPFPNIERILVDIARVFKVFKAPCVLQKRRNSVIVFDMDETLIDSSMKLFYKNIMIDLKEYRNYFEYMILWTHGTTPYLSEVELKFKFDIYLSRNGEESENKGLGAVLRELNKFYQVSKLDFCVLVDDGAFNYAQDYDLFVHVNTTPSDGTYKRTLSKIVDCMNKYYCGQRFEREITI